MKESEKTELAKENLKNFYSRVNKLYDEDADKKKHVPSYVTLKNGDVVEDFYWTDHDITPTALHQWIAKRYNRYSINKNRWAVMVSIKAEEYSKLQEMTSGEKIVIDDVLITSFD